VTERAEEALSMKSYLITDPRYHTYDSEPFKTLLEHQIQHFSPDLLLYRDKQNSDYASMAAESLRLCSAYGVKGILHRDVRLAYRLQADGVHLTSGQLHDITEAKRLGLYVIVSTHREQEVREAAALGADAVTYSPIFTTPNKGEPKGLEDLKEIVGKISINIFALGGITTPEQVKQVEATGSFGFASIRYFIEN